MTAAKRVPVERVGDSVLNLIGDRFNDMNATVVDSNARLISIELSAKINQERLEGLAGIVTKQGIDASEDRKALIALQLQAAKHEGGLSMVKWVGGILGTVASIAMAWAALKP